MKQEKNGNHKLGFTLLELLIVVLIIGILASIALPQYKKVTERARAMEAVQNVKIMADAVERYYLAHGVFPSGSWETVMPNIDIGLTTNGKYFTFYYYKNLYVGMSRVDKEGNLLYMISKVFNPEESTYKRGLTCHVAKGLEETFWGNVCRNLCGTQELITVWYSGQKGCKINF